VPIRPTLVHRLSTTRSQSWRDVDQEPRERPYTQGSLALSFPLADVESQLWLTVVPPPSPARAADASAWAARFLQAVVEVVSSDRPLSQLLRWTDERVYEEIGCRKRRMTLRRQATGVKPGRQQVASVHVAQLGPATAEVAARVACGGRSRAIAARLELVRDRWLCTAITFG
jgi:hypothetical protein